MQLKKLSLAVAVGATLAAPAVLAQSSVQIYGKLYPYLLDERGSGPTASGTPVSTLAPAPTGISGVPHTLGMTSGNSRLGFRGKEDLGGGLRAFFQLEGQAHVDDGTGASGGAFRFDRNTFVGLEGGFGNVKLGNNDTIFKTYGDTIGILGVSSGTFMSSSSVLRKPGFGPNSAASFHLRRANSITYETPSFSGFQAGVQYSTNEAKTALTDPRVWSMGVKYDKGPIYVALMHEIHHDLYGGSRNLPTALRNDPTTPPAAARVAPANSKDNATQFTVEWRMNKQHKFGFDAIRKEYTENATAAGRFSSYDNMAYMLSMENRWNEKFRTAAHYVLSQAGSCTRVAAACSTDGLEGKKFTLGAAYYLSRRTYLFTAASVIKNGKSARHSNTDLSGTPTAGEDIKQYALGIAHSF